MGSLRVVVGDALDEHDESEDCQTDEASEEPDPGDQDAPSDRANERPTNRERIRVYDRDHPGQTTRQVGEALGIDFGTVARHRGKIAKERADELKAAKLAARAGGVKAAGISEEAASGASAVTKTAETQAASKTAKLLSNALTERTNAAMGEALDIGDRIRNWYMGKGFATDPRYPTPGALVDEALQFWWKNRDVIAQLRETVTELSDRLIERHAYIAALNAHLDPDREYARQMDRILSYATECQIAGVKLDRVIWERLLDHAVTYRASMRAHPAIITSHSEGRKPWDTRNQ